MGVIANVIYVDGLPAATPDSLEQTLELLHQHGGMAWMGLYRPTAEEVSVIAGELGLHGLVAEDTDKAHQRPKLERYGHTLFTVLHPARYLEDVEQVEFSELHVFTGPGLAVTTVRQQAAPDLGRVRHRLENAPDILRLGPEAVLYAILDEVVDQYGPVIVGEKGRIVIPKGARDIFGINPGDTLLLLADVDRGIAIVRQDLFQGFIAQALDATVPPRTSGEGQGR
ncbi:CorA family divalent cation transporter [Georgenia sp. Marseille-Q6866]